MSKLFWNALKLSPVILGATLLLANRTSAAEVPVVESAANSSVVVPTEITSKEIAVSPAVEVAPEVKIAQSSQPSQNTQAPNTVAQETSVSQLSTQAPDALAQVTSVSQLSDVQPTDWAFQALQSLVERYGCIAGYPDGTYRGNRALTRYEFAAGLNACLDRVNELIATATADLVTREDLATLQRLQEEFSAELATLRGRVDALEAQTAELEANQFSTTTKLNGEVVAAVSDVFSNDRALPFGITNEDLDAFAVGDATGLAERFAGLTNDQVATLFEDVDLTNDDIEANTVFANRVRLNFDTSFTGRDRLRTRLQARNINPFDRGVTGTDMTRLGFEGIDTDGGNDVQIDDLYYRFPVLGNAILAQVDFANVEFNDNVFTFNPAFESSGRGAISRFGRFNPIYRQGAGGAGLTLTFNPEGVIGASVGYLAPSAENSESGFGLADGAYAALGQIAFRPSESFNVGLTYAHTYYNQESGVNLFDSTGSLLANRPFGNNATTADHFGVEASLRAGKVFTVSGWAGYTLADAESGPFEGEDATMFNWAASVALQDFGLEGSQLGVIFGQPPRVTRTSYGLDDEDTSYHLEGLYRFQLTDNIAITPGVLVIFNPEHNSDNENIYVGTIRTTFTF